MPGTYFHNGFQQVESKTAKLDVGKLLGDYSCLALELEGVRVVEEEMSKMRDGRGRGVPTLQQLAYLQRLAGNEKARSLENLILNHIAALAVHHGSPTSHGHSMLVDTWQSIVEVLEMNDNEENPEDGDISWVVMHKCVSRGKRDALLSMVVALTLALKGANFKPRVYKVSGWLVRYASNVLQSRRGEESPLNSLVNIVAPQGALAKEWKPKAEELSSLALSLPDFMGGLVALPNFQSNISAQRKVRELLQIYTPVWQVDDRHPFVFLLTAEVEENVREVVLTIILDLTKEMLDEKNLGVTTSLLKLIKFSAKCRVVLVQEQVLTKFFRFLLDLAGRNYHESDVKNLNNQLLHLFVEQNPILVRELLKEHVVRNLYPDYQRNFDLLGGFVRIKATLVRELLDPLIEEVKKIEMQIGGSAAADLKNSLATFETSVYEALSAQLVSV